MKNIKIGKKLSLGFGIIVLLILLTNVIGIIKLRTVNSYIDDLTENVLVKERLSTQWLGYTKINSVRTVLTIKSNNDIITQYTKSEIETTSQTINDLQKQIVALATTEKEKQLLSSVSDLRSKYVDIRKEVLKLNSEKKEAETLINTSMLPALEEYIKSVENVTNYYQNQSKNNGDLIEQEYNSGRNLLISITVLAILLSMLVAWQLTRSITHPLTEALDLAQKVSNGDLHETPINYQSKNEIGMLLSSLVEMRKSLRTIIYQIKEGADNISLSSKEIAVGNLDLSNRTEKQAGNLEETASTMEQLTSTVTHNSTNAMQANKVANSASKVIEEAGKLTSDLVVSMKDIKESSYKITEIISVIDSIAFQTNILSLNAAVEAARAGEQGRGFAVVANEVRNLAHRSAASAKEIKALIDNSVTKIDSGGNLVNSVESTMSDAVEEIKKVSTLIDEISNAGAEQTLGITQVNHAIIEIDNFTQQNSALVEQAAAATSSLEQQAQQLSHLVSTFKM